MLRLAPQQLLRKLFGLRSGKHSKLTVANVDVGSDFIRFEENVVKTFHGVFTDLKYKPRLVKHVCHPLNRKHECCLHERYIMCTGFVQACSNEVTSFYTKPKSKRFAFDKQPLGIAVIVVAPTDKASFVDSYVQTRLRGQYNGK